MIETSQVAQVATDLSKIHSIERFRFDIIRDYVRGERGKPILPDDATQELKDLRNRSIINVLSSIVNVYTDSMEVTGYQNADSQDNAAVWQEWNRAGLPSLQSAVTRSAVQYGVGYLTILPGADGPSVRAGSPRNTITICEQAGDLLPQYGLETWVDAFDIKRGLLVDDTYAYPIVFGTEFATFPDSIGEPVAHGASIGGKPVCPMVRFLIRQNADGDDIVHSEIEDLLDSQLALNEVSFTRLIVTRYGAHPMKVISNWEGASSAAATKAISNSVDKVTAFREDVKVQTFDPAQPEGYTGVIRDLRAHIATVAGLNPTTTGASEMNNLSPEALALVDSTFRASVRGKQKSLAGSWKLVLRILSDLSGQEDDPVAEPLWRSLETPTIGSVGDLIAKVSPQGVPAEYLVELIPGLSPQTVRNIRAEMRSNTTIDPLAAFSSAVEALDE